MQQTIHDSAILNFQMAADLLIALQGRRLVLSGEAASVLHGRPKVLLGEGYTSLSPRFGICIPEDARAEYAPASAIEGLEFRNSGLMWMTMEGLVTERGACTCYLDAETTFPSPTVADVFLREFTQAGEIRDTGQTEWLLGTDRAVVCRLAIPEADKEVAHRRVIIHLRQPPARFVIRKLAMTLI
ncbi:hypothetical protein PANO111632_13860 [Paracoccus nototheniae]|uniref:hypothetical protein n=1 Tax=Paracoccus nototheniae TaxID=2489002 RepID=UPI0013F4BB60|nr:hypothetical protein [Paracoccus nototheniae]